MEIKTLPDTRAGLGEAIRTFASDTAGKELTPAEQRIKARLQKAYGEVSGREIAAATPSHSYAGMPAELEVRSGTSTPTRSSGSRYSADQALAARIRGMVLGESRLTESERSAIRHHMFDDGKRTSRAVADEVTIKYGNHERATEALRSVAEDVRSNRAVSARDLSHQIGAEGGFAVPQTFLANFELHQLWAGGIRQYSQMIVTAKGGDFPWPTADDSANTGSVIGENQDRGTSSDPVFGATVFGSTTFSSDPVLVPYELFEDAAGAGGSYLLEIMAELLGTRLGRITNQRFTTGPGGIVNAAVVGVTAAAATAITYAETIQLIHSVNKAYRPSGKPTVGYMCSSDVAEILQTIVNGDGTPVWLYGNNGGPDRLNGYPIAINDDMASSLTAGSKPLLFGDLSKNKIRRVNGLRIVHMLETHRDSDQEGFIGYLREDSNLLNSAVGPVKSLQLAAA